MLDAQSLETIVSLLIIAAIVAVYLLAKRDGRNNPVNTGPLKDQLTKLGTQVDGIEIEVRRVRADLDAQPSAADIAALRGDVKVVCSRVDGLDDFINRTDNSVVRIEQLLLGQSPIARLNQRKSR